jgi:recombination protein RecA
MQKLIKNDPNKLGSSTVLQLINQMVERFGSSVIGLDSEIIGAWPTPSVSLNIALGAVGGLPKGKIIEIFGKEGCGKTTLALQVGAEVQKAGGIVVIIDVENALVISYCKQLGVEMYSPEFPKGALRLYPSNGQEAIEMICECATANIELIILDSVAAMLPKEEIDSTGESLGLQARMLSKGLRKISTMLMQSTSTLIMINQERKQLTTMPGAPVQDETTGGKALKYYSSMRIKLRQVEAIKVSDKIIGNHIEFRVLKNRFGSPCQGIRSQFYFGQGFCVVSEAIMRALRYGTIQQKGAWFYYADGSAIGQGFEIVRQKFLSSPALFQELLDKEKAIATTDIII